MPMKKILYSLILLSVSAALFSQPRPAERTAEQEGWPGGRHREI